MRKGWLVVPSVWLAWAALAAAQSAPAVVPPPVGLVLPPPPPPLPPPVPPPAEPTAPAVPVVAPVTPPTAPKPPPVLPPVAPLPESRASSSAAAAAQPVTPTELPPSAPPVTPRVREARTIGGSAAPLTITPLPIPATAGPGCSPYGCCPTLPGGPPLPPCDQGPQVWLRKEVLLWWVKSPPVGAPLVTTGPIGQLGPGGRPGVIGAPGTQSLLGGEDLGFGLFSGARFTLGGWIDDAHVFGAEGSYFFLGSRSASSSVAAPGTPGSAPLALPFFDATLGRENSTGIALPVPPGFAGAAMLQANSRLQGAEINGLWNWCGTGSFRIVALGGFRWLSLHEGLAFQTISGNVPPLPRDVFQTSDEFGTSNNFYGGQLGLRAEVASGSWFFNAGGKVALGGVHEAVRTQGALVTNDFTGFGPVQAFPGGYLVQPTNSGSASQTRVAFIPEVNFNVGYQPTSWLRLMAGYSFLYLNNVLRPGNQIDRTINPTQGPAFTGVPSTALAGPPRPTFPMNTSSFWAQGLSLGVELRY